MNNMMVEGNCNAPPPSCLTFDEGDPRLEQYHKPRVVVLFRRLNTDEEITEDTVELVVVQLDTVRPQP